MRNLKWKPRGRTKYDVEAFVSPTMTRSNSRFRICKRGASDNPLKTILALFINGERVQEAPVAGGMDALKAYAERML